MEQEQTRQVCAECKRIQGGCKAGICESCRRDRPFSKDYYPGHFHYEETMLMNLFEMTNTDVYNAYTVSKEFRDMMCQKLRSLIRNKKITLKQAGLFDNTKVCAPRKKEIEDQQPAKKQEHVVNFINMLKVVIDRRNIQANEGVFDDQGMSHLPWTVFFLEYANSLEWCMQHLLENEIDLFVSQRLVQLSNIPNDINAIKQVQQAIKLRSKIAPEAIRLVEQVLDTKGRSVSVEEILGEIKRRSDPAWEFVRGFSNASSAGSLLNKLKAEHEQLKGDIIISNQAIDDVQGLQDVMNAFKQMIAKRNDATDKLKRKLMANVGNKDFIQKISVSILGYAVVIQDMLVDMENNKLITLSKEFHQDMENRKKQEEINKERALKTNPKHQRMLYDDKIQLEKDYYGLEKDYYGLEKDYYGLEEDYYGLEEDYYGLEEKYKKLEERLARLDRDREISGEMDDQNILGKRGAQQSEDEQPVSKSLKTEDMLSVKHNTTHRTVKYNTAHRADEHDIKGGQLVNGFNNMNTNCWY